MGLSKKHLSSHAEALSLDLDAVGEAVAQACPEIEFAYLMGSSMNGHVEVGSDIDIAVFTSVKPSFETLSRISKILDTFAPGAHCDCGFLNNAEPVYRFEALRGRLLFARDPDAHARFFSLTCREYESQIADYTRQKRYRMEAA